MSMNETSGIPEAMQFTIKRLKVLQKETISITPNKTTVQNRLKQFHMVL